MSTPEPIHVAFVWHMHQPYYRSARTGAFQMPWVRLHALKDYVDMVEVLADYPTIHQTFNLVPSLVEQLEDYAAGGLPTTWQQALEAARAARQNPTTRPPVGPVSDVYWEHIIKPATDLVPSERAFLMERMCERPDHPRAQAHPRYLQLCQKRQAQVCHGWDACAAAFTADELRDLQIWFDLAWCDPTLLETEPLLSLVQRGRDYSEEDKQILAQVQNEVLRRVVPAYEKTAAAGQIELSTSPYFHPILPLLANTDSARIGAGDTILPHRRFAHPEDAQEQVESGIAAHERVFGTRPRGMWCSEQAVGEDVLPLLMGAGIRWTISGQTVLARSKAGSAAETGTKPAEPSPYIPYLLRREEGELSIVFRDHVLSDLIGFGYQSWDSREAAKDLIGRIRAAASAARSAAATGVRVATGVAAEAGTAAPPLVTIALDGENAWEYYPHDGRDFLHYLYDGLAADPAMRCVTISEHLEDHPATTPLPWLHTGSWIGGDLRTWSGDQGHNTAWGLLHDARDMAAAERERAREPAGETPIQAVGAAGRTSAQAAEAAWRHVLIAEGSDWFWWFGEHHHTELDYVWDLEFRQHLQEVYRRLQEPVPIGLYLPVFAAGAVGGPALPVDLIAPVIDGRLTDGDGWDRAGLLTPDHPSTMQRAEGAHLVEVRFGWGDKNLYLLLIPRDRTDLDGLEMDLSLTPTDHGQESVLGITLVSDGGAEIVSRKSGYLSGTGNGAWQDVAEVALALAAPITSVDEKVALTLRVGRGGMTEHVFRSTRLIAGRDA